VIDGYPKTLEQAKMLFLVDRDFEEEEEEEYREDTGEIGDVDILPELVVVLEASDDFLKERVMNLPESEIQNTHYTEEHMLRRLREYRYSSRAYAEEKERERERERDKIRSSMIAEWFISISR